MTAPDQAVVTTEARIAADLYGVGVEPFFSGIGADQAVLCTMASACCDNEGRPAFRPAGSPWGWRRIQGAGDVGHLKIEQIGGLELRGDPSG